ncbi:hypothetical protein B0T24DRAFT_318911 [Lasiosphaeria ovina]|uniref:Uncharacterized protein n=1 Tax=Lasiosphaeria ovina TaxID=92902 RepID=A0AAE0K8B6_9PEZI|nr:hypothetical protein B0T24DRAFT_318911 [Lasiosphaeria ovina]
MNGTMDGAAKNADKVAQRMLPNRPHHLSLSLDRRYPTPEGFWFTGPSGPLQYMTYLSDASRGVLITRPSYDVCQESDNPLMPVKVLARGEVKKKLSIKDYQNRKKSLSPKDNELPAKVESKPNGALPQKAAPENTKAEEVKPQEKLEARQDPRLEKPRSEQNGERTAQPKPQQPEAGSRKRGAETDGSLPPQKRPKSEATPPKQEPPRRPIKAETPPRRDRVAERAHKDASSESLHPTANGLAPSTADRERGDTASPKSTIQVNGTRTHSDSGTSTPRKGESLSKSYLPVLLSPLHPSLFGADQEEQERSRKKPAQKGPAKSHKPDSQPAAKKPRVPFKIPELLSPTLPPIVEAELARLGTPSLASSQGSEPTTTSRKTKPRDETAEVVEPSKPSRVVTLKFKKANAKRLKDLLSLPSKAAKDALKKERSMSVEGTPPPARKRPRQADDAPPEAAASKRSKLATDVLATKPAPSTPLKQSATAMSRVTSNQSLSNTPGNWTGLTPATSERPPTSSDNAEPIKGRPTVESLRERNEAYRQLGSRLKHTRDDICRERGNKMTASDERRVIALHFEMVLAYMVSFHSLNQARMRDRKVCDVSIWESLLPHLHELEKRVRNIPALRALACQMHAVCLEQITLAFGSLDAAAAATGWTRWVRYEKTRLPTWSEAAALGDAVDDRRMKTTPPVGPWTPVEDVVAAVLDILRRWADRESVDWKPVILRDRDRSGAGAAGAKTAAPPNGTKT